MGTSLMVREFLVSRIYELYKDELLYVNRRYQRKLVWTLQEKAAFVDTVLRGYPIPLILLVSFKDAENKQRYEVLDGLQRLDAIISFIEGKFPVEFGGNSGYFDLEALNWTNLLQREGVLQQKTPKLPFELCTELCGYPLPISITEQDDETVEEVFRRINSTGKKLSSQDLRQAGVVNCFTELVRRIACRMRGDVSKSESIRFKDMQKISISNKGLEYGIDLRQTFWYKHQIITGTNIRLSKDEELISYILSFLLLGKKASPTARWLDVLYNCESIEYAQLAQQIRNVGDKKIEEEFMITIGEIDMVFNAVHSNFSDWCFKRSDTPGKRKSFQILFLALYGLRQKGKQITDYKEFGEKLKGLGDSQMLVSSERGEWTVETRQQKVSAVSSILGQYMRTVTKDQNKNTSLAIKVDEILDSSRIEQQMYDFKLCAIELGKKEIKPAHLKRIGKTLVAIANTRRDEEGFVFLGIADKKEDAEAYEKVYNTKSVVYANRYVVGIENEATQAYLSLDKYTLVLKDAIKALPISTELKDYVLRNFNVIFYRGKTIVQLSTRMLSEAATYDGVYYIREGSSTRELQPGSEEFKLLMKRVYSK